MPDRSDGVNDKAGFEIEPWRDARLAGRTPIQFRARLCELWTRRAMNRAAHAANRREGRVGGVHNSVDIKLRDVSQRRRDSHRGSQSLVWTSDFGLLT